MSNQDSTQHQMSTATALQHLIDVVAQLRSPDGGCPWDLAQTPETLTPYVIEEAYEVVGAIKSGDQGAIAEELGDLLLQVVLQAQIASEAGSFSFTEVAQGITQKLIRRHPHVFGNVEVQSIDEVRQNWEQIKAAEKGESIADTQYAVVSGRILRPETTAAKSQTQPLCSHTSAFDGWNEDFSKSCCCWVRVGKYCWCLGKI